MQYAKFGMKIMRFSAIWNTSTPHKACSGGSPKDYPTDLVGKDGGRDWFYAPCDMVVLKRYTKASHAIWLRSKNKVYIPSQKNPVYLYMMSEHQDNREMGKVGHVYRQGEKMFREAANGNATGNHLHVSFGYAKTLKALGSGWTRNSRGAWVLYIKGVTNIKIEQALYLDKKFTTSIKDKRITFKELPKVKIETETVKYIVKTNGSNVNVRKLASINSDIVTTVKNREEIEVSKIVDKWAYVPKKNGYVSIDYIKKK